MHRPHKLAIALLLYSFATSAQAAEDEARLWLTGIGHVALPAEIKGSLLVQARFFDEIEEFERLLVNPSLEKEVGGGFAAAIGYDAHIFRSPKDRTEHRAWQQLGFRHDAAAVTILHRVRFEERFLKSVDGVALRLRYMLGGSVEIPTTPLRAVLSDEVFLDLNSPRRGPESGFGENRFFAGIEAPLGGSTVLQVGYQLQYEDRQRAQDLAAHTILVSFAYGP